MLHPHGWCVPKIKNHVNDDCVQFLDVTDDLDWLLE